MLARWFIRQRAFPLALTLWLLVAGPVGPLGLRHAATPNDPGCEPRVAANAGRGAAAIGSMPTGAARDHCAVCHWMQSFRLGLSAAVLGHGPGEVTTRPAARPIALTSAVNSGSLPARAPPADPVPGF